LTEREKRGNRTRSKIRSRIEHVFGIQAMRAGRLIVRTIGIFRARCKIGLRNLAYNIDRYAMLATAKG
jgi:tetrahydromethanopterin S-methyltransferase subunit G